MTNVEELPELLLTRLPGLRAAIEKEIDEWRRVAGDPPPSADYCFGIVVRIVAGLLTADAKDADIARAREVLDVLEEFLRDDNQSVRDAVDVSFSEQLADDQIVLARALRLAGPLLRASLGGELSGSPRARYD